MYCFSPCYSAFTALKHCNAKKKTAKEKGPGCGQKRGSMKKVGIIMGSDSDLPVVEKAADTLKGYGIPVSLHVYSAHRTPKEASDFAKSARNEGYGALICAAGMAAHLAGAIAANTTLPVIGIPIKAKALEGMDALLSTVMMPPGIPVAAVGIDGAQNAAILAVEILSIEDPSLGDKLQKARDEKADAIRRKDAELSAKYSTI